MSQGADSITSIFFALGANLAIAVAKLAAAVVSGSGAMMAEAIHSFADTGNQGLLLLGLNRSKRPPSPDYPLGHGKAIYFWSFIVALMLFSIGGMYSVFEGFHKLNHPEPLDHAFIVVGVLLFSLSAEGISLWGCMREINKDRRGRSLLEWFGETRRSELLIVFGEDFAALLGLCFALIAVGWTVVTGNPVYDAAGSIVIGLLLVSVAIGIGNEVKGLLIGQGVEPALKAEMKAFLESCDEVERVLNIVSLQLGSDVMVAVKSRMADFSSAEEMVRAINRCEKSFKLAYPQVLWLFFEPDLED